MTQKLATIGQRTAFNNEWEFALSNVILKVPCFSKSNYAIYIIITTEKQWNYWIQCNSAHFGYMHGTVALRRGGGGFSKDQKCQVLYDKRASSDSWGRRCFEKRSIRVQFCAAENGSDTTSDDFVVNIIDNNMQSLKM